MDLACPVDLQDFCKGLDFTDCAFQYLPGLGSIERDRFYVGVEDSYFGDFLYLSGGPDVFERSKRSGYPQQTLQRLELLKKKEAIYGQIEQH